MNDNTPFFLNGIDHVVLRCREIAPMIAFYRDVIGCELEREIEELGLYQMRAGTSLIDLVDCNGDLGRMGGAPPGVGARNMDHFCLRVSPWNEADIASHLERHGVGMAGSGNRYGAEGFGPSIYIEDPEGNTVELKGPPNPA